MRISSSRHPHLRPRRGRGSESVNCGGGGDLGFGDGPADRFGGLVELVGSRAHTPQDVLAGEEVPFFEAGVDQTGEAGVGAWRPTPGGLVEYALEVAVGDGADGGQDVEGAVA